MNYSWTRSPWLFLLIIVVVIFAAESAMMLTIDAYDLLGPSQSAPLSMFIGLVDALVLTLLVTPLVYLLLVRPLFNEQARQRQLRGDLKLFRETMDHSPDGIFIVDPETADILDVNRTAQDMLGYTKDELLDMKVQEINLAFGDEYNWDEFRERVRREGPVTVEGKHQPKDDTPIPVQVKVDQITLDDEARQVAIARDLSDKKQQEEKLRDRRRRFEAIFDSSHSLIGLLNADGTLIEANQSAMEIIDESLDSIQGQPFWETPWWSHSESLQDKIREGIERAGQGQFVQFEATHPTADGKEINIDFTLTPIENDRGKVEYLVPEGRDITAQKQLQEKLETQRNFLETIINSANQGIFVKNWEGEYVLVNQTVAEIFGVPRDQIEGQTDHAFVDDEAAERFLKSDREVIENNEVVQIQEKVPHATLNETREYLTVKAPIYGDRPVEERLVVGITTDITKRSSLQDQLKQQKEFLQTIIDSAPTMIFVKNWDGEFQLVNQSMADFFGVDKEEIAGKKEHDFLSKNEEVEKVYEDDREVLRTGEPKEIPEERFQHPQTGEQRVFRTIKIPLDTDQQPENRRVLGIATDVTALKNIQNRLEQTVERLELAKEAAELGIWAWDIEEESLFWDDGTMELFGVDSPPDGYEDFVELIHPDDLDRVESTMEEALESGDVYRDEFRVIRPSDGETRWIEGRGQVFYDDGNPVRMVGTNMNITERKELQQKQERLARIIQNSPDYIGISTPDGQQIFQNKSFQRLFNIGDDDITDYNIKDFHPDHEIKKLQEDALPTVDEEGSWTGESLLQTPDGREIPVSQLIMAHYDNSGEVRHYSTIMRDISELKQYQQDLREREERFQQMTNAVDEIFWLFNRDFSELLYLNEAKYQAVWGRDPDRLDSNPEDFLEGIHPDDRQRMLDAMDRLQVGEDVSIECRVNPREDFERYVEIEGFPVRNENGEIRRLAGTGRDITDRKKAEEQLKQSEYRFRQMSENIDEAFYLMESDYSEVLYTNSAIERIYGITQEELYEDPEAWARHIVDEDLEKIAHHLDEQQSGDFVEPQEQSFRVDHPERGRRHVRAHIYPIREEGSADQLVGISSDITEVKEIQQSLEDSLREKETLLQEVHHRVKNNMQIITSLLRMQSRDIEDENVSRVVAESQQRVQAMALIHEQLYQSENLAQIDYADYIKELTRGLLGSRLKTDTNVDVEFDLETGVYLDLDQAIPCGLIISELVTNAMQHAFPDREQGQILISFHERAEEYSLRVADDGVGMEESESEELTSMGRQLTQTLAEDQLKGSLIVSSSDRLGGTETRVTFPKD